MANSNNLHPGAPRGYGRLVASAKTTGAGACRLGTSHCAEQALTSLDRFAARSPRQQSTRLNASQDQIKAASSRSHWACTTYSLQCPGTCCDMWCSLAPSHTPAASRIEASRVTVPENCVYWRAATMAACVEMQQQHVGCRCTARPDTWLCKRAGVSCQYLLQTDVQQDTHPCLAATTPVQRQEHSQGTHHHINLQHSWGTSFSKPYLFWIHCVMLVSSRLLHAGVTLTS